MSMLPTELVPNSLNHTVLESPGVMELGCEPVGRETFVTKPSRVISLTLLSAVWVKAGSMFRCSSAICEAPGNGLRTRAMTGICAIAPKGTNATGHNLKALQRVQVMLNGCLEPLGRAEVLVKRSSPQQ